MNFLPRPGISTASCCRAEFASITGVEEGDEVGTAYDPLLAKLIAHGSTRDEAIEKLTHALQETVVCGVTTNLPFLRWLVGHPAFRAGEVSTAFLLRPRAALGAPTPSGATCLRPPVAAEPPHPAAGTRAGIDAVVPGGRGGATRADHGSDAGHRDRGRGQRRRRVTARQTLVVLEAMKMEMPVAAPFAAAVTAVHVEPGDQVAAGTALVELG